MPSRSRFKPIPDEEGTETEFFNPGDSIKLLLLQTDPR